MGYNGLLYLSIVIKCKQVSDTKIIQIIPKILSWKQEHSVHTSTVMGVYEKYGRQLRVGVIKGNKEFVHYIKNFNGKSYFLSSVSGDVDYLDPISRQNYVTKIMLKFSRKKDFFP